LAPAQSPRIAVTVLVDEPHGEEHYGGKVAGPAWIKIVGDALAVLGLPADSALLARQKIAKRKLDRRMAWRLGIDFDKVERRRKRNEIPLAAQQYEDAQEDEQGPESLALQEIAEQNQNAALPTNSSQTLVPDFSGMGLAKALATARKAGIEIEIKGSGCAIDQSPPPGLTSDPGIVQITFTDSEHAFAAR